ncbi:MAG: hypothetical protein CMJ58_21820 [Planctomycetaceae bacterium]|nr:hypothetical protein [Planctomycetaceae bacterium]
MKRYRVNYLLLFSLIGAAVIVLPAFYFLWRFQLGRNADRLKVRAKEAMSQSDPVSALEYMSQYVTLRPEEVEASREASRLAREVLESKDFLQDQEARGIAYGVLRQQINETGDAEVRRTFVDALTPLVGPGDSSLAKLVLDQVDELIEGGSTDQELYSARVQMLQILRDDQQLIPAVRAAVGYDPQTDDFTADATAPQQPQAYAVYAQYLRGREEDELSDRVIERMVEMNPDSAEAHIIAYRFNIAAAAIAEFQANKAEQLDISAGKSEEQAAENVAEQRAQADAYREQALASLERAYEIAPEDADVLDAKGRQLISDYQRALRDGQTTEELAPMLDEAAEFLELGATKYPERLMFVIRAAQVEQTRDNPEKALKILRDGAKRFELPSAAGIELANMQIEILLSQNDIGAVKAIVEELREYDERSVKAFADYHAGRLQLVDKKWADAARTLRLAKMKLLGFPRVQSSASYFQGVAHEMLGQYDLAVEAYEWAVAKNSDDDRAAARLISAQLRAQPGRKIEGAAGSLEARILQELEKPKDEQDWEELDQAIEEFAEQRDLGEAAVLALKAQTMLRRADAETNDEAKRELFTQARALITKAYQVDRDDIRVRMLAIKLLQIDPDNGPERALKLLEQMLEDPNVNDSPTLRSMRAELLVACGDADVVQQLENVAAGIEDWSDEERAQVYSAVGRQMAQVGAYEEAGRLLAQATELVVSDLPTARLLFDVALRQQDPEAIEAAQQKILAIVGSETAPDYVLTEIRRRLVAYESGKSTKEEVQAVGNLLENALRSRSGWSELWVAKGQYELSVNEDATAALQAFDRALESGRPNPAALRLQVTLLARRGRMGEALEKMELLTPAGRTALLGRLAATIYAANGRTEDAYNAAQNVRQARPGDAETQIWFAEFALQADHVDEAETAVRTAAEINPYDPVAWSKLIGLYAQTQQYDKLEGVLREAHLSLDEEFLPLLSARYYELQGRWHAAEDIYLSAYRDQMDSPDTAQRLAEFYSNWPEDRGGDPARAAKYLNQLLRMSYEGELEPDDRRVAWARRRAAKMLAVRGDYASAAKAEQILRPLVEVSKPDINDLRSLAQILSSRLDPEARLSAIELWNRVKDTGQMQTGEALLLGRLMSETGQRSEARAMLEDLIARNTDNIDLIRGYALLLIEQRDSGRARRQIATLDRKGADPGIVAELNLRLAARAGETDKVREILVAMTPDLRALTAEQLEKVRGVAELARQVGDNEYALQLYREYARRKPEGMMQLARLTGLYGDPEAAIEMLKRLFDDNMDDALRNAVEILRQRRSEVGDILDSDVDRLVRRSLSDDPENARRLILQAEVLEIEEKFDESMAAYESVLRRNDLPTLVRATALNNLAFLIALKGQTNRMDEALEYANQAISLIGPISDLLDTRAVAHLGAGDYQAAVKDMRKSVQVNPTAGKYFHLAQAELGAGNEGAAMDAWKSCLEEGMTAETAPLLEREAFAEFAQRMADLGGPSPEA